jgi:hypothetical protein
VTLVIFVTLIGLAAVNGAVGVSKGVATLAGRPGDPVRR